MALAVAAEMVAPIANMLEAAVAAGNLNEPVPAPTYVLVDDTPRPRCTEQGGTSRERWVGCEYFTAALRQA